MEEIWKDIAGYEGYYQVSNLGRVRSVDRIINNNYGDGGSFKLLKGRILKNSYSNSGYPQVILCVNGVKQSRFVHRLVAEAFIPNPNNLTEVNHKDEDKSNNMVDNLEWCSRSYNANYGTCIERRIMKTRKPVIGYDKIHKLGTYFSSAADAGRFFKQKDTNMIRRALKGKAPTAYGYKWYYAS